MKFTIRKFKPDDKHRIIKMMRVFYASDAVHTNGSEEIFCADFDSCISESPYVDGFAVEADEKIIGYTMIAKSFSTEFGKRCIWIEDLYIGEDFRGMGAGRAVMDFITKSYTDCIFRLEVEEDNKRATALYKSFGFDVLPYTEMKR